MIYTVFCILTWSSLLASLVDCSSHPVQASLPVCYGAHSIQTAMWFAGLLGLALAASVHFSFVTWSAAIEGGAGMRPSLVALTSAVGKSMYGSEREGGGAAQAPAAGR